MFLSPQDGWIKKFRTWEKRVKNSIIRRAPALEEWFFLGGVSPSLHAMSTSKASRKQLGSISDLLWQWYIDFEHIIISANKNSISFFDHKKTYRYFWLKVSLYPYLCTSLPNCGHCKGMTPKHKFASLIFHHIYNYTTWYLYYSYNVLFTQFCPQNPDIVFSGYFMRFIYKK